MQIRRGFPPEQRERAAALFWQAFSGKLGRIMAPERKALTFLATAMQPDNCFSVLDADGRLVAVAGIKSEQGGLVGGGLRDLAGIYGWFGALWRGPLLDLMKRDLKKGQMLLDGIFVDAESRGQGVGSALIDVVVEEARGLAISEIRLDVIDRNIRAKALYERHGFVETGRSNLGPFSSLFGFEQSITMCRTLQIP